MRKTQQMFLPIENVPTVTAQEHKVKKVGGRIVFYDPPEIKAAKTLFTDHLAAHRPEEPFEGPLELVVKWCFKAKRKTDDGTYKTTKPDTDNLQKMLKDCITRVGFWKDDALVCREIVEKFWAVKPGIFIRITEMGGAGMSEDELKIYFEIFQDCWRYLKDHSDPDDSEEFWNRLRDDGSALGKQYDDLIEHQLASDLVVAVNGTIQRYYRRNKDVLR